MSAWRGTTQAVDATPAPSMQAPGEGVLADAKVCRDELPWLLPALVRWGFVPPEPASACCRNDPEPLPGTAGLKLG